MNRVFAQLDFPGLPLEAVGIVSQTPAAAVYAGQQLIAANSAALEAGIYPGMTLSLAQTLCPGLHTQARRSDLERQWLHQWAHWAYGYSDQVAIRGQGLCLEIAASHRLFGEVPSILKQLNAPHREDQRPVRLASGASPEMADVFIAEGLSPVPADYADCLARQPIRVLAVDAAQKTRMQRMGMRVIGDLLAIAERDRLRRFPASLQHYLNALTGRQITPLTWFQPPAVFRRTVECSTGLETHESMRFPMHRLLQEAGVWLRLRQAATDRLEWLLRDENRTTHALTVQLNQPDVQLDALMEPTWLQLARWDCLAPIREITLQIQRVASHVPSALDLFQARPTEHWRNRLQARLGPDIVQWPQRQADPRPEQANSYTPRPQSSTFTRALASRPLWLVDPPEYLGTSPQGHQLLQGPERLETGWWDGQPIRRSYWITHTAQHRNGWVYQEGQQASWWLAGWFN